MAEEEYFDVVDEEDRVVGRATRRECHARGLIHRCVMMFVLDGDGGVIAHRRSAACDLYPSAWSIGFGGHVSAGETYEEAVRRELFEETGLDDAVVLIGTIRKRVSEENENARVYLARATRPVVFPENEVAAVEVIAVAGIDGWIASHQPCVPETQELKEILVGWLEQQKK